MFVAVIPNRNSPPAILLRETYRENGKVKNRTLANLTSWPPEKVEALRRALRGEGGVSATTVEVLRSLPHGHVAAALGMVRTLEVDKLLGSRRTRERDLLVALVVQRIVAPASKFATARSLSSETAQNSLGALLGLGEVGEDELYEALDTLLDRQPRIEKVLAAKHLAGGELVLYDLTSTWFEGHKCPLARPGYSRDGRGSTPQIVFGVLTDRSGRPVAVEVFEGNTGDPSTVAKQIEKLKLRFGLERVVLVGDRGMITDARLREDVRPAGLEWITALRAPAVKKLVRDGAIQLSLFEKLDLAEISHPDFPGERLVVCKNPLLADQRTRKRNELLAATEKGLKEIAAATQRTERPLRGSQEIAMRVGREIGRYRMRKHFIIEIGDTTVTFRRDEDSIHAEAATDGLYVVRTTVDTERMSASEVVGSYKLLARVERVFRSMKTVDLDVRPIRHRLPERVRAHVLLCMLAYYVRWHMERKLAPLLFTDEDPAAGATRRSSVVAPARRSQQADDKAASKTTTDERFPVQSFKSLLADLATVTRNRIRTEAGEVDIIATPTPLQAHAFELLGVSSRG
jgi:hypothetical protein